MIVFLQVLFYLWASKVTSRKVSSDGIFKDVHNIVRAPTDSKIVNIGPVTRLSEAVPMIISSNCMSHLLSVGYS